MAGGHTIIIDYGMGNIWSVLGALRYLGHEAEASCKPEEIVAADNLILPGVGSFRRAMERICDFGLDEAIWDAVKSQGKPILGICLGMQLLGSYGTEDGNTPGLALVPNRVEKLTRKETENRKIPHIGFNSTHLSACEGLFAGLPKMCDFYYVHSYRMLPGKLEGKIATCNYGIEFLAGFEVGNICGTQFHPEKSQTNGLILLKNFLEL